MTFYCDYPNCDHLAVDRDDDGNWLCNAHLPEELEPDYEPYSDWELDADWEDFMFEARNYH